MARYALGFLGEEESKGSNKTLLIIIVIIVILFIILLIVCAVIGYMLGNSDEGEDGKKPAGGGVLAGMFGGGPACPENLGSIKDGPAAFVGTKTELAAGKTILTSRGENTTLLTDGNVNTCAQTMQLSPGADKIYRPYFVAVFGKTHAVLSIKISVYMGGMIKIETRVGNHPEYGFEQLTQNAQCWLTLNFTQSVIDKDCPKNLMGKYVTLQADEDCRNPSCRIHFCELEIYGFAMP